MIFKYEIVRKLNKRRIKEWNKLWNICEDVHFFNSPNWTLAYLRTFKEESRIVFCYRVKNEIKNKNKKELVGILPLVFSRRFGVKVLNFPNGKHNYSCKVAFLLRGQQEEDKAEILHHLIDGARKEWGSIFLGDINDQEKMFIESGVNSNRKEKFLLDFAVNNHYGLIKKDVLINMPRKQRKSFLKKLDENLKFKVFKGKKINKWLLDTLVKIEGKSCKEKFGISFLNKEETQRFFLSLFSQFNKNILIGVLYFKKRPISYLIGFIYDRPRVGKEIEGSKKIKVAKREKVFLAYNTAFDNRYRKMSPGKVVVYFMLKELQKSSFEIFDYSKGDNNLKKQFVDEFSRYYNFYYSSSRLVMFWWSLVLKLKKGYNSFKSEELGC